MDVNFNPLINLTLKTPLSLSGEYVEKNNQDKHKPNIALDINDEIPIVTIDKIQEEISPVADDIHDKDGQSMVTNKINDMENILKGDYLITQCHYRVVKTRNY